MGDTISVKRQRHLDEIDRMPSGVRECVHEYGYPIVKAITKYGITKPSHIRDIVREVWAGARQENQTSGAYNTIEWLLGQQVPTMKTLRRVLADNDLAIVPCTPTKAMLEASMIAVNPSCGYLTKTEKHRRRLSAAVRASIKENDIA